MKPLTVEVIAYAPTQYFHCQHCEFVWDQIQAEGPKKFHADALETSMPKEMMAEYSQLSDWVIHAAEHYGGRVVFKVIDAMSVEGFFKSLLYRVRQYPAFAIGTDRQVGGDFRQAQALIDKHLAQSV